MTEFKETELDERAIKMAKVLSADAVERAGHCLPSWNLSVFHHLSPLDSPAHKKYPMVDGLRIVPFLMQWS